MKKSFLIFILICFYAGMYPFTSKFLAIDTNSLEYQVIENPEAFPLEKSALIISGINEDSLGLYIDRISNIEAGISNEKNTRGNAEELTKFLFLQIHKKFLKEYEESQTTLDSIINTGRFNCLSSTLLYNSILEDFGVESKAVILPSHAYTLLNEEGREIDVENTSPYGYDIGTNREAQETFKKLTGFSYSHDPSIMEIVGKKGLLAYTYANMSYFNFKSGRIYESFQDALKSWAIFPDGKFIYSNVSAAYTTYSVYLADTKSDYTLSLSILREAIENIPQKDFFFTNYFYVLDKYLNSLIDSSRYDKAFVELDSSEAFAGTNNNITENLYSRILYRLINHDGDYEKAYEIGKKALAEKPNDDNYVSLMISGMNLLSLNLEKSWQDYPKGEDFILKWHELGKNTYFDSILENYYNQVGLKFYDYGDPLKAIDIMKKGLAFFPKSRLIKNNIAYITGNTANVYFGREDYDNSIKFLKIGLEANPDSQALKSNLIITYRTYDSKEIENKDYSKALSIAEEGLSFFPNDPKLTYYRDYLRKKIK